MNRIPPLVGRKLFRRPGQNPADVTGNDMFIAIVVDHDLPGPEVFEQKLRLLKKEIVCLTVRRIVILLNADHPQFVAASVPGARTRFRTSSASQSAPIGVNNSPATLKIWAVVDNGAARPSYFPGRKG
jgi:hypothetical protein